MQKIPSASAATASTTEEKLLIRNRECLNAHEVNITPARRQRDMIVSAWRAAVLKHNPTGPRA